MKREVETKSWFNRDSDYAYSLFGAPCIQYLVQLHHSVRCMHAGTYRCSCIWLMLAAKFGNLGFEWS